MIALLCQPDEFAPGYEGRLTRVNLDDSVVRLRSRLAKAHALPSNTPRIVALAAAAGLDVTDFVQFHTTLACRRFVSYPNDAGSRHGDPEVLCSAIQLAMTPPSNIARYCQRCVDEDHSRNGFSYWRRTHHLQGIDWCPKHLAPLTEVPVKGAFLAPPTEWVEAGGDLGPGPNLHEWPILFRLMEIALRALELRTPVSCVQFAHALKARLQERGLRMSRDGARMLLSDYARQQLPASWLARYFPAVADKRSLQYAVTIDSVARGSRVPLSHLAYLLSLALLCSSADDAIDLLESARRTPTTTTHRKLTRLYPRAFWRSNELRQLYVACQGRHRQLAEKLGLSLIHIRNELSAVGLPTFGQIERSTANALLDFLDGVSLEIAIDVHAAPVAEFEYWLRQDLHTIRPLLQRERRH